MPDFERDGWRLAYDDQGTGPAVLFIHGLLMDRTMFDAQAEALANRYRVVLPDLRGHGESEHGGEPYDQWDLMEDDVALLDHLGIERAVWGGVSQGGFQSLRASLKHPDRVAGLVLIDTQAGPEDETRAPMYEASAQVAVESGWNEDLLGIAASILIGASASDAVRQHWIARWLAQDTSDALQVIQSVTRRDDITDRLPEIQAPAIVIHGTEDVAIDMDRARELADGLAGPTEFVTVDAGHSSTVEQQDAVTAAIEGFLERVWPA
ncbi:MAG: alpha/beta fold hydrolase [Actinomycetota bacterium]